MRRLALALLVRQGAAVPVVWQAVRDVALTQLIAPRELVALVEQLEDELAALSAHGLTAPLTGPDALGVIATTFSERSSYASTASSSDENERVAGVSAVASSVVSVR